MGYPTKIATCCHCGTRATLRLDKGRHALSCASCGAPLSDLKMLPGAAPKKKPAISHWAPKREFHKPERAVEYKKRKPRKAKRRSKWFKNMAEELFDFVEDIFD